MTPTLVNFSNVLLQAIVALTPWPSDAWTGAVLALIGLAGVGYGLKAVGMKRRASVVELHGWNRLAYNSAPVVANVALVAGGAGLVFRSPVAPFAIAASSTLLLAAVLFGAWDVTLWVLKSRKT